MRLPPCACTALNPRAEWPNRTAPPPYSHAGSAKLPLHVTSHRFHMLLQRYPDPKHEL